MGDGKCLKAALEKNGYQPKEVLRKWALAALRAYDETFPQTDPFKWRDWSWEDFRLPNDEEDADDLLEDRDAPSSPDSDEGKQSSKAESDVNEDDDNGDGDEDDGNGEDDEGSDNAFADRSPEGTASNARLHSFPAYVARGSCSSCDVVASARAAASGKVSNVSSFVSCCAQPATRPLIWRQSAATPC